MSTRSGQKHTTTDTRPSTTPSMMPADILSEQVVEGADAEAREEDLDIEALSASLGDATEAEVMELIGNVTSEALEAEGARVATSKVSKDAARIVRGAQRFFATASPAVILALCMSPEVLRVLAWSAAQGERAWRRLGERRATRKLSKAKRRGSQAAIFVQARADRDQVADALRKVLRGDDAGIASVDAAMSPAAQGLSETGPGQALTALVALGRECLASSVRGVKARCAMWGITAARLDLSAKIATKALAAERGAAAPADDFAQEQARVDRWDGVNMLLIGYVVRAFAKGHARGKAVPKLRLLHLRNVLNARKPARKPAAPPIVAPVTPPASPVTPA